MCAETGICGHPMHPLDHPVRNALFASQVDLAVGGPLARRYRPEVHPFAATIDPSPEAMAQLAGLLDLGERVILMEAGSPAVPRTLRLISRRKAVQLLANGTITPPEVVDDMVPLSGSDAEAMQALTELTRPGPFARETWRMGNFYGIHEQDRLVAMAGERLHLPGFVEVSGVCTHPDARARGLATRLSRRVASDIQARGAQPFLHAWGDNAAALRLYQGLGFQPRAELTVTVLERVG